ncbi:putative plant self-incompatibility S1 [Medicago truncatula]|uniref:S-protein homolog n=1 Tax=Medicago truncatula TaxID=3880 RepID=A0A072VEJ3_MEDTR|nr:leguminosin group486 secreted peptide [Medicago truncatula]RHN77826.1 putative plant self-incompatibility S1 [Medicago truncatula]
MALFIQKFLLTCVLLLLTSHNVLAVHSTIFGQQKVHVYVYNDLPENVDLTLHCQSKDDDLGSHILHHGDNFNWSFGYGFFKQTLFHCSFQWNNELHSFNIVESGRDECFDCLWYIRESGPCLVEGGSPDSCIPWKK